MPVWTFRPDPNYPPRINTHILGTGIIKYTITNQSRKTHTLEMLPIQGITQDTSTGNCPTVFTLAYQQSCTLKLVINGNTIASTTKGGPIICEQGSLLQCYQPSPIVQLNIELMNIFAGMANGEIYYSNDNGITWTAATSPSENSAVNGLYVTQDNIYAASANGRVYISNDKGHTWQSTSTPPNTTGVTSISVRQSVVYIGTQNGKVFYSTNNGLNWLSTESQPRTGSINSLFWNNSTLYSGSQDGKS